jgi:hypothetical protein
MPHKRGGGISTRLTPHQLDTLKANYQRRHAPYVFVGASLHKSYAALSAAAHGSGFVERTHQAVFVDVHDVPGGTTTVRIGRAAPDAPPMANFFAARRAIGTSVSCIYSQPACRAPTELYGGTHRLSVDRITPRNRIPQPSRSYQDD